METKQGKINTEITHQYLLYLLSFYRSVNHPHAVGEKWRIARSLRRLKWPGEKCN